MEIAKRKIKKKEKENNVNNVEEISKNLEFSPFWMVTGRFGCESFRP